jgi:hypothetical protein
MSKGYLGKWQEYQAFFFSLSKLRKHSHRVVTKPRDRMMVFKGVVGVVFIGQKS